MFIEKYAMVKRVSELSLGVMTQCIKKKNFCGKGRPPTGIDLMTAGNLLMKINHKMNGSQSFVKIAIKS